MSAFSVIGSGRVATCLSHAFLSAGHIPLGVYSRCAAHAARLAHTLGCNALSDLSEVSGQSDFVIISVSDDALGDVVAGVPDLSSMVLHTAGARPMSVLSRFSRYGVLYPLQTFSFGDEVSVAEIPFFIEADSPEALMSLQSFAETCSRSVRVMSSEQRQYLHLAAVWACNFVNLMYAEAEREVVRSGADFSVLRPLIAHTAHKILSMSPLDAMTGPAARGDHATILRHLALCPDAPTAALYRHLSERIMAWKAQG